MSRSRQKSAVDDALLAGAENALSAWDLRATAIELVSHSENIVFRVDTVAGKRYALRLHRPGYHSLEELNAEHQWIAVLGQAGLGVPTPKTTRDGRGYVSMRMPGTSEHRYVGLVEWLDGVKLVDILDQTSDEMAIERHFHQLGRVAARLHNQATVWQVPAGFRRHAFDADGLMGADPFWGRFWELPSLTDSERRRILDVRHAIYRILLSYGKRSGTYSLIHADLHPSNVLINGSRLYVIDFDDAGFGWHQYDLAVALFNYRDDPQFSTLQAGLFAGYRSERVIDSTIPELLPLFLLIRALVLLGWVHDRPELEQEHRLPGLVAFACEQADTLQL